MQKGKKRLFLVIVKHKVCNYYYICNFIALSRPFIA